MIEEPTTPSHSHVPREAIAVSQGHLGENAAVAHAGRSLYVCLFVSVRQYPCAYAFVCLTVAVGLRTQSGLNLRADLSRPRPLLDLPSRHA